MGVTGGIMLASQGAVAAAASSAPVLLAANSCGGGSYQPSGNYAPNSGYAPSSGSYAPNAGMSQNSCGGGTYSRGRAAGDYNVPNTGMDEGSVSTDDQPAGYRNQPGMQPNACSGRSSCGGMKNQQPQTSMQTNQPYQAPQQMMPQNNAPSASGPNYQDNAAKRADINR